jgi:NADH dehydrogenase [ubiquinone] 1 alpha subcomplex assembly factor 5
MLQNLIFDRQLLRQKLARAHPIIHKADFLIKRSFNNILENLNSMNRIFDIIVEIDPKLENTIDSLFDGKYSKAYTQDDEMITTENGQPLINYKHDLIVNILNMHNINDLPGYLFQLKNGLTKNGLLLASMFGEMNLQQLKSALTIVEMEKFAGISPRMMPLVDLKQLGALLQRAGFDMIIVDIDKVTVEYNNVFALIHDLRAMGETNIMKHRSKKYLGLDFWLEVNKKLLNEKTNTIFVDFEIINIAASA